MSQVPDGMKSFKSTFLVFSKKSRVNSSEWYTQLPKIISQTCWSKGKYLRQINFNEFGIDFLSLIYIIKLWWFHLAQSFNWKYVINNDFQILLDIDLTWWLVYREWDPQDSSLFVQNSITLVCWIVISMGTINGIWK